MVVFLQQAFGSQCTALLDRARPAHESYALAHGMEYRPFYGYVEPMPFGHNSMAWAHYYRVLASLPLGAILLGVDADALVVNGKKNIAAELAVGKDLALCGDGAWVNSGVVLARKTGRLMQLLERVFAMGPLNHEHQIDVRLHHECKDYSGFQKLGDEWNWFDHYLTWRREQISCLESEACIRHWAGMDKSEVLALMSEKLALRKAA